MKKYFVISMLVASSVFAVDKGDGLEPGTGAYAKPTFLRSPRFSTASMGSDGPAIDPTIMRRLEARRALPPLTLVPAPSPSDSAVSSPAAPRHKRKDSSIDPTVTPSGVTVLTPAQRITLASDLSSLPDDDELVLLAKFQATKAHDIDE